MAEREREPHPQHDGEPVAGAEASPPRPASPVRKSHEIALADIQRMQFRRLATQRE